MEDKKMHNLMMENRERVSLTGVKDIHSFDDELVLVETELGILTIKGFDLKMNKLNLDNNELLAIRYHMGGYDNEDDRKRTSDAWLACPLALLLHQADAQATYLDETQYEQND